MQCFLNLCLIFALCCGGTEAMTWGVRISPWRKLSKSVKKSEVCQKDLFGDLNSAMIDCNNNLVKFLAKEACRNHFFGWSKNQKARLLFYAVENNLEEVVKDLAKENKSKKKNNYTDGGFDFNVRGWLGETPLLIAIDQGNNAIVECLLENGADPNMVDSPSGLSPLMFASCIGNESLVRMLIRSKANVNALSCLGCSPLSLAMGGNHLEIVRILKNAGADVYLENQNGDTPISMALYYEQKLAENDKEKSKWNTVVRILEKRDETQEEAVPKQSAWSSVSSFFRSLFNRKVLNQRWIRMNNEVKASDLV